jgi:hypothetical protein
MDRVKGAPLQARPDRTPSDSGLEELMTPDNPVLQSRQVCQASVDPPRTIELAIQLTFCPSRGLNVSLVRRGVLTASAHRHAIEVDRTARTRGALSVTRLEREREKGSNPAVPPLALIP